YFFAGQEEFEEAEDIAEGMGPRMNLDSCGSCHLQPALGGTSPAVNPQVAFASKNGGTDVVPSFIRLNGPVRETRFVRDPDGSPDGGVHALLAITGQTNKNGNDGTIARFGWKGQNKSLLLFSGEAYNVEMGVTNELFQTEREETEECQFATHPNSITNVDAADSVDALSAIEKFAFFMRFLAPPAPSPDTPGGSLSIANGRATFRQVGCALCHAPSFTTGNSAIAALRYKRVRLFSDLLLHDMR